MKIYLWDENFKYSGEMEVDPKGSLPPNSTTIEPFKASEGNLNNYWNGRAWIYDENRKPLEDPSYKSRMIEKIEAKRYEVETSGLEISGMFFDTSRDSQSLITGAALAATLDPKYTVRWKTSQGFYTLNAEQIVGIAMTIRKHVQDCFDREADLTIAVEDGTFTEQMLEEGW